MLCLLAATSKYLHNRDGGQPDPHVSLARESRSQGWQLRVELRGQLTLYLPSLPDAAVVSQARQNR